MRLLPLLMLLAVGFAACGGDDSEEAEKTVREFVAATNARDADKLCDELLSQEFIEAVTAAKGDSAKKACKQQFEGSRVELDLTSLKEPEVESDSATVTAEIETRGQRQRLPFKLKKEDGEWRIAGGTTSP